MSTKLTVIIPTLNEADRLSATLAGLGRPDEVEIMVADGGSRDATRQVARQAGARIVSSRPGRALQMNRGAGEARGRFLVFLHADTHLPDGYLAEIETILTRPGVTAGAFRFQIDAAGWGFRLVETCTNLRARLLSTPYGDQGLFLRARTLRRMGGYREIPIMEDFELVRRLARSGKVVISPMPASTSGRRWKRLGLVRTTLLNWTIVLAYWCGVSPIRLAGWYRCRAASRPKNQSPKPGTRNSELGTRNASLLVQRPVVTQVLDSESLRLKVLSLGLRQERQGKVEDRSERSRVSGEASQCSSITDFEVASKPVEDGG